MPVLSVRISTELNQAIKTKALSQGFNDKSEYIRTLLERDAISENNLDHTWQTKFWGLFGIDAETYRYILRNSKNADEFFSILTRWSKVRFNIVYDEKKLKLKFFVGDEEQTFSFNRDKDKIETIRLVTDKVEYFMMEAI